MSKYLSTTGNSPLSIFVCPRCKMKRAVVDQVKDPNTGLIVCNQGCSDLKDPYRLPSKPADKLSIRYPRPDTDLINPDPPYDPT